MDLEFLWHSKVRIVQAPAEWIIRLAQVQDSRRRSDGSRRRRSSRGAASRCRAEYKSEEKSRAHDGSGVYWVVMCGRDRQVRSKNIECEDPSPITPSVARSKNFTHDSSIMFHSSCRCGNGCFYFDSHTTTFESLQLVTPTTLNSYSYMIELDEWYKRTNIWLQGQ